MDAHVIGGEEAISPAELESHLGYTFKNRNLLQRALTHRSFVNEHENDGLQSNEAMEFLGDAVLGFLVSSRIFGRFPDLSEGDLSKIKAYLVSAVSLLSLADKIELGRFLRLSRGEEKTGGRRKRAILVDAYEALIGAIYLDGGVGAAESFVHQQMGEVLDQLDLRELTCGDFKSALQERLHNLGIQEPVYRVIDEIGPDHKKIFVVEVEIPDRLVAQASGRTKKEAQQAAARSALESLREC